MISIGQILRLESNLRFASTPEIGAQLVNGLRAAKKAGGCKQLWRLSVTLKDFDNNIFLKNNNNSQSLGTETCIDDFKMRRDHSSNESAVASTGRTITPAAVTGGKLRNVPAAAHPMNALAFVRAFHTRAPGGSVGATPAYGNGPYIERSDSGGGGTGKDINKGRKSSGGNGDSGIISLGLPHAKLQQRTIVEIATHVLPSLTHLDLSYCFVGPAGAATLARSLDGRSGRCGGGGNRGCGSLSLCSLELPHNAIGNSGARALAKALETNRCLTSLSLASNSIGPEGGHALAESLVGVPGGEEGEEGDKPWRGGVVLARLNVGDNPLGERSTRMLVSAAATATANRVGSRGGLKVSMASQKGDFHDFFSDLVFFL